MLLQIFIEFFKASWFAMESDLALAACAGVLLLFAFFINAAVGIWKSRKYLDHPFEKEIFLESLYQELLKIGILLAALALAHMFAILVGYSLMPELVVGDIPVLAILAAFGVYLKDQVTSVYNNVLVILHKE